MLAETLDPNSSSKSPPLGESRNTCGARERLQRGKPRHRFRRRVPAHLARGPQAAAHRWSLRLAKQGAAQAWQELHARYARRLAMRHTRYGRRDRGRDATRSAARTAVYSNGQIERQDFRFGKPPRPHTCAPTPRFSQVDPGRWRPPRVWLLSAELGLVRRNYHEANTLHSLL